MRMTLRVLTTALLALGAAAQPTCPHRTAVQRAAKVEMGTYVTCDQGITDRILGVDVRSPEMRCPLFVIVTPAHASDESTPGSQTYTELSRVLAVVRVNYDCIARYFLIFNLGSSCIRRDEVNAGAVNHYVTVACLPKPATVDG